MPANTRRSRRGYVAAIGMPDARQGYSYRGISRSTRRAAQLNR